MQEIIEFCQLLPAVIDWTKVFKFCQDFYHIGSSCSLNKDKPVRLTKNFLLEMYFYLQQT